jgi:acyl-CoA hydrolase
VETLDADTKRPSLAAPEVRMADLVLPNQTNYYRTMFGGAAMAFMDKAAAIAALRFCRMPIVTGASEQIDFRQPVHEGEIIEALAKVIYAGRSSMIARVHIYGEHALKGDRRLCTTGFFSIVAVSPEGNPLIVPELLLEDDTARAEWEEGERIHRSIRARHAC